MNKKKEIFRVLNELAIPCSIIGKELLESAIEYIMEHGRTNFTRELYPLLARKFSVSSPAVDRGIRMAIEVCINNSKHETLEKIFGNVYSAGFNLTVQNFIYGVVKYLKLQEEN